MFVIQRLYIVKSLHKEFEIQNLVPLGRYINLEGARVWAPWDAKKKGPRAGTRGPRRRAIDLGPKGPKGPRPGPFPGKKKSRIKTFVSVVKCLSIFFERHFKLIYASKVQKTRPGSLSGVKISESSSIP